MKLRHNQKSAIGKCEKGKCGTVLQGWKMRDSKVWQNMLQGGNCGKFCYRKPRIIYRVTSLNLVKR